MIEIKRIASAIMILTITFSVFSAAHAEPQQPEGVHSIAVGAVSDLDILRISDDNVDDPITRGQFIEALAHIAAYKNGGVPIASTQIFSDVNLWDVYAGSVQYLSMMGIINGSGQGLFRGEDVILLEEACKMLVILAGYAAQAEYYGGYPVGYLKVAGEIGLLKSVGNTVNLNMGTAAQMIYNTLRAKKQTLTSFAGTSDNAGRYRVNETLAAYYMEIYEKTGIVTATEYETMFNGKGAGAGKIEIDEVRYEYANGRPHDSLGCLVSFWYKSSENSTAEVIYSLRHDRRNTALFIEASDILSVQDRAYSYHSGESGRTTRAALGVDVTIVYNGRPVNSLDERYLRPTDGFVRLIDNTGDGAYDVVYVSDIQTITVSAVNYGSNVGKVFGKNSGETFDLFVLDEYVIMNADGWEIPVGEIAEWNVLSIRCNSISEFSFAWIDVSTAAFEGNVSKISENSDGMELTIGGRIYKTTSNLYTVHGPIGSMINVEIKAYLDKFGKISAIVPLTLDIWRIGYIITARQERTGIERHVLIKLLDQDGKIYIKTLDKKLIVDGASTPMTPEATLAAIKTIREDARQLIRYKEIGGKIKYLDLATEGFPHNSFRQESIENSLLRRSGAAASRLFIPSVRSFGGNNQGFVYSSNPLLFCVPDLDVTNYNDNDFGIKPISYFLSDRNYKTEGYSTMPNIMTAGVIVYYMSTRPDPDYNDRLIVIESITTVLDTNGAETIKINGHSAGAPYSVTVKYDNVADFTAFNLKKGDILRVGKNLEGEAVKVLPILINGVFNPILGNEQVLEPGNNPTDTYYAAVRFFYGIAVAKDDFGIYFAAKNNDGMYDYSVYTMTFQVIYVFDKTGGPGRERVYMGTVNDIMDASTDNPSKMVVATRAGQPRDIVVIKDYGY